VLVDGVSSIGGVPFQFDDWGIDFAVTSSQKCLMSSPGMSFVAISDRAWKSCESSQLNKSYFNFPAIRKSLSKLQSQTPGTTPVHLIMQVNAALSLIHEEGIAKVFARHDEMGKVARDWVKEQGLSLQCPDLEEYSPTLTAIRLFDDCDPQRVREHLKQRGIFVARGIGHFESNSIRIGHMGDIRPDDLQHTLDCLTEIIKSQGAHA
ncbi:MAG TPA: aminotransferase class V-fold PLP-dependent enzyme, partial [Blastocatellia bacterium]|nr:aminotransferase class V-fold PLP-dependent enzyme [Blastocatellia bacterium]